MKIGATIGVKQSNIYYKLNKNRNHSKKNNKNKKNSSQENLSFDDIENMMKRSSYKGCRYEAIKQIK